MAARTQASAVKYHHAGPPKRPPAKPASIALGEALRSSGGRRSLSALFIRLTANSSTGAAPAMSGRTDQTPHWSKGPIVVFVLAAVWWFAAKAAQARRGVDLTLSYKVIPPE